MIEFNNTTIEHLSLHKVGNKILDEGIKFSKTNIELTEEKKAILMTFFLSHFTSSEYYSFSHDSDIQLNEVFIYVEKIFDNPNSLFLESKNLVKHLYKNSNHPNIKMGEFYTVFFSNCFLDGKKTNGIGLFKSENKDIFLEIEEMNDEFGIESRKGININKLDKGCLILNIESKNGFIISLAGNNKSSEAQYWTNAFLQIEPRNDEYHQTNQFLGITKKFITNQFPADFETNKTDQIDLLNRSVDYFKKHDNFDKEEFENEVLQDKNIISSFKKFDSAYRQDNEIEIADDFSISAQAVKKQERAFKSVLKLDKNFHIYIHGDRQLIEQGVEKDGRKFYKIYYKDES